MQRPTHPEAGYRIWPSASGMLRAFKIPKNASKQERKQIEQEREKAKALEKRKAELKKRLQTKLK